MPDASFPVRVTRFLFASLVIIGTCMALAWLGEQIPVVSTMIEHNRAEQIDASALFYTESERAHHHTMPEPSHE